ncbi:response regulator [Cyclobacterium qasimii]|uniref:Response regulator n=2 Tax=Cyclobacterium qasimii TaxID=1350429 RepID=S7X5T3_9BACT|nr:response regulator [Cyclobacterium qasimii]EPR71443.1 response regulator [Cyclobacterium qasimii M12-11B]GEO23631.1 response regulator [Cyclobacterium qasimii]
MKSAHILLVEDNEGDIFLTTEALNESENESRVSIARDGQEALDFIFKINGFEEQATPDLIILDVNLPKKSGHEVLIELKNHDCYKQIPVIILSTSSSKKDIDLSYQNFANCYITKPVEVTDFMKAISSLQKFWLETATLPVN